MLLLNNVVWTGQIVHLNCFAATDALWLHELLRKQALLGLSQQHKTPDESTAVAAVNRLVIITQLQTITPENLHQYIPLGRSQSPGPLGSSPDLDDADLGLAEEILSVLS